MMEIYPVCCWLLGSVGSHCDDAWWKGEWGGVSGRMSARVSGKRWEGEWQDEREGMMGG